MKIDSVVCKSSDVWKLHQSSFVKKCGPVVLNYAIFTIYWHLQTWSDLLWTKLTVEIITWTGTISQYPVLMQVSRTCLEKNCSSEGHYNSVL